MDNRSSAVSCLRSWLCVAIALGAACASPALVIQGGSSPAIDRSTTPPSPDPRIGLKGGWLDAGQAAWNMRLLSTGRTSDTSFSPLGGMSSGLNSDLAFTGNNVVQGNFRGFLIWDVSNPRNPRLASSYVCRGS